MNKKEQNNYLITYIIMDFLRFIRDLKERSNLDEETKQAQVEELETYANLYLTSAMEKDDLRAILNNMKVLLS